MTHTSNDPRDLSPETVLREAREARAQGALSLDRRRRDGPRASRRDGRPWPGSSQPAHRLGRALRPTSAGRDPPTAGVGRPAAQGYRDLPKQHSVRGRPAVVGAAGGTNRIGQGWRDRRVPRSASDRREPPRPAPPRRLSERCDRPCQAFTTVSAIANMTYGRST